MKLESLLLVLVFALTPAMRAQEKPAPAPPGPGAGSQMRAEHRQQMMEMHEREMEAMKADVGRMKSSLAQMKAVVLTIRDPNELSLWRTNVDMWETVVARMDRMQKNGVDGTRHDARAGHGRPASRSARRKEAPVTAETKNSLRVYHARGFFF